MRATSLGSLRPAIAALAVIGTLAAGLLELGVWTRGAILEGPFIADGGHGFRADLTPIPLLKGVLATDGDGPWNGSRLRLSEDGVELTQAHTAHQTIRDGGGGRFSHWHDSLYFSASDNSDPNVSGHIYSVVHSVKVRDWVWGALAALLAISYWLYRRESGPVLAKISNLASAAQSGRPAVAIQLLLFVLIVAAPILVVINQFASGRTTYQSIGGLLPWADSNGWMYGALRILLLGQGTEWSARRPLNAAFFASLLGAGGLDLITTLLLRAALLGATVYLFFREVLRAFGLPAALLAACIVYGFAYPFIGITLSETNGVIFGTLGITVLLHATRSRSSAWFGLGLLLLTVGLLVRSGPFFVLPALLAWSACAFSEDRRVVFRPLVLGICGVAGAWLVSKGVAYLYMPPGILNNANFSYVIYGLAKGGESWQSFFNDVQAADPQFFAGRTESDLAKEAYARALDFIIADPRPLLRGMLEFTLRYIGSLGAYAPPLLRWPLLIIAAAGLVAALLGRGAPERRFLLVGFIGMAASASVIYWSSDAYRNFAPTIAFDALIVALGARSLTEILRGNVIKRAAATAASKASGSPSAIAAGLLGVSLVAIAVVAPAAFRAKAEPVADATTESCPEDTRQLMVQLGRGSVYIRLTDQIDAFAPEVSYEKFRRDPDFANVEIADFLRGLEAGDLLIYTIEPDGGNQEYRWLRAPARLGLVDSERYRLCARLSSPDAGYLYDVVAAHAIEEGQ